MVCWNVTITIHVVKYSQSDHVALKQRQTAGGSVGRKAVFRCSNRSQRPISWTSHGGKHKEDKMFNMHSKCKSLSF